MVKNFVTWLDNELNEREWTRADLARRAGITQSSLSMIYNESRSPGPDTLTAIAKALGLPPETVFRAAGILPPAPPRDARKEIILHLADQLPDEEYDDLVAYIKMRLKLAKERGKLPNGIAVQPKPAARSA